MRFDILHRKVLDDKTYRIDVEIDTSQLMYFGYFIEAHEGWCNYTTINKNPTVVQVDITPDFIDEFLELLGVLKALEL